MKRYLSFFAITLLLASCSKSDETSADGSDNKMHFTASVASKEDDSRGSTRGVVTGSDNIAEFGAFCYNTGRTPWATAEATAVPNKMFDVEVLRTPSTSNWVYNPPVAWEGGDGALFTFFGYSPRAKGIYKELDNPQGNNIELTTTATTTGIPILRYSTLDEVSAQVDLLVAKPVYDTRPVDKVKMQFAHALSQIRFKGWSAQQGTVVASIAVNGVRYKGTAAMNGQQVVWTSEEESNNFSLVGNFPPVSTNELSMTDLTANGNAFMLLPQDMTANSTAEIVITATIAGVENTTNYTIKENWQAGKSYTYTIDLGGNPTEEIIITGVTITDWMVDSEEDMSTTPPANPVTPPTANDYVEIDGLKWTKGNLVATSSTASKTNGCKVGAPEDGGLYFQFGSLIGWKGGDSSSSGTGQGTPSYTSKYWGGAASWSWSNDAMVWPTAMSGTPSAWPQATSGTAHQWYFSGQGVTSGGMNETDPIKGVGDPCTYYLGDPWRTPTADEYKVLFDNAVNGAVWSSVANWSWVISPYNGAQHKSASLYFPASGTRYDSSGAFSGVTTHGYYWSSSVTGATYGSSLSFTSSYVSPQYNSARSNGLTARCVSGTYVAPPNPVNPPTANDYVEINGLYWTKGNLVASSSTASGSNGCKVGAPEDGGLYFQFGSLIGWKGGAAANGGTGQGTPSYTSNYWGGATSFSWDNDAMVWPTKMAGTPSAWPQATSGTAHQWYFSGNGVTSGTMNETDPIKGVGDPCTYYLGDSWRMPTAAEYKVLFDNVANNTSWSSVANWSWVTSPYNGAQHKSASLYFPASGTRYDSSGAFGYVTVLGYYWSSSVTGATYGSSLNFSSSNVYPQGNNIRFEAFPVRCVSTNP